MSSLGVNQPLVNMDDHCKLQKGEIFQDFDCLLNFVDEKSDKFYRIQLLQNDKGFFVWNRWGRNVGIFIDILYECTSHSKVASYSLYLFYMSIINPGH